MQLPRNWKVATAATATVALAGLGIAGLAGADGRSGGEDVGAIALRDRVAVTAAAPGVDDPGAATTASDLDSPFSNESVDGARDASYSVDSPDDPATPAPDSVDSPASVDSVESAQSVESVESIDSPS